MLDRISNGIQKYANRKYIIPVLILFILILILMQKSPIGSVRLAELSGGTGMLDMQFGYTAAQVHVMMDHIGTTGRVLYTNLLSLDFLFILVYTAVQTLLITALMRKANLPERWRRLNLLPFVRSVLDVAENVLLLSIIASFPVESAFAVGVASLITTMKLVLNYGYIGIVFLLGAWTTRKSMLHKMAKQNYKESRQES